MFARNISRILLIIIMLGLFAGCASTSHHYAPVVDLGMQTAKQSGYYVVRPGDTLYFIAWRLDRDYQDLAAINNIQPPYSLRVGQKIYLSGPKIPMHTMTKPAAPVVAMAKTNGKFVTVSKTPPKAVQKPVNKQVYKKVMLQPAVTRWIWPAKGSVIQKYSASNKGINISGTKDENVVASAAGEVVYAGNGLHAYGNLLIIKHNDTYLSAYAHNEILLVKEGALVKQGQVIARMGSSGTTKVMLHFEIRQDGKPVNPLKFLH